MKLWGYDFVEIMKTWWDGSYDWSVALEGYELFRRNKLGI